MLRIAIQETTPALSTYLTAALPDCVITQARGQPADPIDLLILSPDLPQTDPETPPAACRALLLPGRLTPLAAAVTTDTAITYGLGPKDTLTLSTLRDHEVGMSLQRDVVTLDGEFVDRQEFTMPRGGESPLYTLAAAGVRLLLGELGN